MRQCKGGLPVASTDWGFSDTGELRRCCCSCSMQHTCIEELGHFTVNPDRSSITFSS